MPYRFNPNQDVIPKLFRGRFGLDWSLGKFWVISLLVLCSRTWFGLSIMLLNKVKAEQSFNFFPPYPPTSKERERKNTNQGGKITEDDHC